MAYFTFFGRTMVFTPIVQVLYRVLAVGILSICLWSGSLVYTAIAHAATTPEAEAYDAGPIRQTRNPISGENFNGGVAPSTLDRAENPRQPEDEDKGIFEAIKDTVTGNSTEQTSADMKTEKNPTLQRYTEVQK